MVAHWKHGILLSATLLALAACSTLSESTAKRCFENKQHDFHEVLACYRQEQATLPLRYTSTNTSKTAGIEKRSYDLISQSWSPENAVSPVNWSHGVDIYIPENAIPRRALLIINNGINHADANTPAKGPSDFPETTLREVSQHTRTIVISVSNVPNQYLKYQSDGPAKREDDSVAYSWKLFLDAPEQRPFVSLHIPMMEAVVKTMDMAERELKQWDIRSFIVAGASKRGWSAWHAAIADRRIEAIVPFVIDVLNTRKMLDHTYEVYGGNWPTALTPYYREGVTARRHTLEFEKLMKIEDPLLYLNSAYADRLAIPKYLVNASGDTFFVPDNARLYFDQLPGTKTLRVVPNSDHYGVGQIAKDALITFVNRLHGSIAFPTVISALNRKNDKETLSVQFSEAPVLVTKWTAINTLARDFRYACGIRYVTTPLPAMITQDIPIEKPTEGWTATFVEARFADGMIATTPVFVSPDIPSKTTPPSIEPACKTISVN